MSSGSEKALAHTYRSHLRQHGHIMRVENMAGVGMCDINQCFPVTDGRGGVESWVELKQLDRWPMKEDALVLLPHYTPQQRVWQTQRHRAGGRVYVLLQVDEGYYLLPGYAAATVLGKATRSVLLGNVIVQGQGAFPTEALLKEFTSVTPYQSSI